ncbi:MAG: DUF2157 domain-containing protein [Anaerolineae bacterium]|nr:DUF2157 domain-containing protein [Anaerolineae bacterium]MDQ7035108.1 DUF2157 domain-containing protein [Anaerolineae bacterium]
MAGDWQKSRATPQRLWRLHKERILPPQAWERSQEIAGHIPTTSEWMRFVYRLLMASGTIFLIAGIFFFFAFNWEDLPRLGRFAIIEGAVIIATVLAFILNIDTWGGRIALGAAAMLIGVTFAVVGQAYQTGADSYRLFMMWAIVITGWVLISRWNILWLIWLVLINITISLYWSQIVRGDASTLNFILIGLNVGFVLLWDGLIKLDKFDFMQRGRWFLYLLMIPTLIHATYLMLDYIFGFGNSYVSLEGSTPFVYIGLMVILGAFYTTLRRDLFILTLACVSILVVLIAGIGRILYESMFANVGDPFLYFLFMGIITVGLTGGLAFGLRQLQKQWGEM